MSFAGKKFYDELTHTSLCKTLRLIMFLKTLLTETVRNSRQGSEIVKKIKMFVKTIRLFRQKF